MSGIYFSPYTKLGNPKKRVGCRGLGKVKADADLNPNCPNHHFQPRAWVTVNRVEGLR